MISWRKSSLFSEEKLPFAEESAASYCYEFMSIFLLRASEAFPSILTAHSEGEFCQIFCYSANSFFSDSPSSEDYFFFPFAVFQLALEFAFLCFLFTLLPFFLPLLPAQESVRSKSLSNSSLPELLASQSSWSSSSQGQSNPPPKQPWQRFQNASFFGLPFISSFIRVPLLGRKFMVFIAGYMTSLAQSYSDDEDSDSSQDAQSYSDETFYYFYKIWGSISSILRRLGVLFVVFDEALSLGFMADVQQTEIYYKLIEIKYLNSSRQFCSHHTNVQITVRLHLYQKFKQHIIFNITRMDMEILLKAI